jgi:hypothetical protein
MPQRAVQKFQETSYSLLKRALFSSTYAPVLDKSYSSTLLSRALTAGFRFLAHAKAMRDAGACYSCCGRLKLGNRSEA